MEKYASRCSLRCFPVSGNVEQHWRMLPFRTSGPFRSVQTQWLPAMSEFRSMKCSRWISNGSTVGWGKAGRTCWGPWQAGFMLVAHYWNIAGWKGLILADVSKGEHCPFIVNVNEKENRSEALVLVSQAT